MTVIARFAWMPLLACSLGGHVLAQQPPEKPPEKPHPEVLALNAAFERAAAHDKRVAVFAEGQDSPQGRQLVRWWRRAKIAGVPLRYEYELVHFKGDLGLLSKRLQTPVIAPAWPMVLCAADGKVLSQRAVVPEDPSEKMLQARLAWLAEHKVAMPDAHAHLAAALASAKKTDRRVLVHLGAPW